MFNVCLLNFYQDGTQRIGWHCNWEEIGRDTPIMSILLGARRDFYIWSKTVPRNCTTIAMTNGLLTMMEDSCQHHYLHSIPKQAQVTEGWINLTFWCKPSHDTTCRE